MGEKKTVRLGIDLTEEQRDRFKLLAIGNKTDMGTLVRGWIEDYIKQFENPAPKKKRPRVKPKKEGVNSAEATKTEDKTE